MKTLHSYLFALKMANNTLISQIVVDFVSKFSIFNCFRDFGGGHSVSKVITFPKFCSGGSLALGNISQVSALFNFEDSPYLRIHIIML